MYLMKVVVPDVVSIVAIMSFDCNAMAVVRETVPVTTRFVLDVLYFCAVFVGGCL